MASPDVQLPVKMLIMSNPQTSDWEVTIEFTGIPTKEHAQRIVDLFREVLEERDANAQFSVMN